MDYWALVLKISVQLEYDGSSETDPQSLYDEMMAQGVAMWDWQQWVEQRLRGHKNGSSGTSVLIAIQSH